MITNHRARSDFTIVADNRAVANYDISRNTAAVSDPCRPGNHCTRVNTTGCARTVVEQLSSKGKCEVGVIADKSTA